jgi:tetratricopeptide (TPR) repeat protein
LSTPSQSSASSRDATLLGEGSDGSRVAPIDLDRGHRVARYLLLDLVGQGSMGRVYSAYDPELDRRIAIKLVPCADAPDDRRRDRFLREAKAMARIDHPHVISVHDAGVHEDWVWVAMALIDGPSLEQWLATGPTQHEILDVMIGAGRGLEAAHRAGVVHRDFKPGNVLVGAGGVAKVGDFGLAGMDDPTTEAEDSPRKAIGTPAYMSPEHIDGANVDARSDQFSYCVALAQAMLGERPFIADTLPELARKIVQAELSTKVAHARGGVGRLLRRGLSPDPADRFPSMTELLDELERTRRASWPRWALALTGLAVAGSVWMVARDGEACPSGASQLDTFWDGAAQDRVNIGGEAYTAEFVAESRVRFIAAVDAYAAKWVEAFEASCERVGPQRELGSPDERQEAECIDNRRASLQALVDFASVEVRDAGAMGKLVAALPAIDDCGSKAWIAYPSDPEQAAWAAELHRRIERIKWARIADASAGQLDEARDVTREARELGDPHVIAVALRELGRIESTLGDDEAANAHFDEALELALQHRFDRVAAGAINELVIAGNHRGTESPDLLRLATLGVALAERSESFETAGSILINKGNTQRDLGDIDGAVESLARAADYLRRAGSDRQLWRVRLNEVALHVKRHDRKTAVAMARELREDIAEALTGDAVEAFHADRVLIHALTAAGEYEEVLALARESLARVRRVYTHGSNTLHEAAWNNALAAVRLGHVEEAEECMALAKHPSGRDRGTVAGLEGLIAITAGRLDEAAEILDGVLQIEPRVEAAVVAEMQRAHVHLLAGEPEQARALLERVRRGSEIAKSVDLAVDFAVLAQVAGVAPPEDTTWTSYLQPLEPDLHASRLLRSAALAMVDDASADVAAARDELARTTHEASPEVRLLDMWLARQ